MAKVSIKFFPSREKKTSKGKTPIYLRIGFNKKKAEYRLNAEVDEKDLPYWNERMMRFDIPNYNVNNSIDDVSITLKKFISLNELNLYQYDAKKIRDTLFNRGNEIDSKPTWVKYYQNYYDNSIRDRAKLVKGTKKNYYKAINHMDCFLKKTGKENIKIEEVDMKFARAFTDYLLNDKLISIKGTSKQLFKKGMGEPSALSQIKKIAYLL